jgi:hypothetical protein
MAPITNDTDKRGVAESYNSTRNNTDAMCPIADIRDAASGVQYPLHSGANPAKHSF